MELEEDDIPFSQADHWIWNVGVSVGVFQVCGSIMPLQQGVDCRFF